MRIFKYVTAAFILAGFSQVQAQQTVNMTDGGSVTIDCGAGAAYQHPFSHDGSPDYAASVNDTITVCPDGTNGSKVTVRLTSDQDIWVIHETDSLYIYDGVNTSAPLMGAFNAATDTNGIVVTATIDNPSGCLTFVFISDAANEGQFAGLLFCGYPCQPFTPYIASTPVADPGFPDTGYIDICQGDTVWMWAQGIFPHSSTQGGIGYHQELTNSSFEWELADGTSFSGVDTIMVVPGLGAGYDVQLVITDTLGCPQAGFNKIRVGTTPSFAEVIELLDDTICTTESTFLLGGINTSFLDTVGVLPQPGSFINGGVFTGLTYLPDGNGVEYETTIPISGFDSLQVIENASDIIEVCLTIEHSYLGDLEMSLTCPNGTEIVMFNSWTGQGISAAFAGGFGGGGTYLGDALDGGLGTPGIGWEYCFSETAVWGTLGQEFGNGNTVPGTLSPGNSMAPGDYQPEETYTSFLGCPINGDWTITVRDNIGIDDGYIFEWGILFDPTVNPNVETYEMQVDSTWWSPSANITQFFGDTMIEVMPGAPGNYPFTFNIEDNFGCEHDTTIIVTVDPPLSGTFGSEDICSLTYGLQAADTAIIGGWTWTATHTPGGSISWTPDSLSNEPTVTAGVPGQYTFYYESACGQVDSLEIVFNAAPEDITWADTIMCLGDSISFDAGSPYIVVDYNWNIFPQNQQIRAIDSLTETTVVEVTVTNDCGSEVETATVFMNSIGATAPPIGCDQTSPIGATNAFADGSWSFIPPSNGSATFNPNASDLNPDVDVDEYGLYRFIYTDELCGYQDTVSVEFFQNPEVAPMLDTAICIKDTTWFDAGSFPGVFSYSWNTGDTSQILTAPDSGHFIVTASGPCGEAIGEVDLTEWDCSVVIPTIFNTQSQITENSFFNIPNLEFHPGNEVIIFDRWGRKCYEQVEYQNNPWLGEGESSGVFYWILNLPQIGQTQTGYVHLLSQN